MSRLYEFTIEVVGNETDKATFNASLYAAATSAGFQLTLTGYKRESSYSDTVQMVEVEFLDLVASSHIAGLTVNVVCQSHNIKFQ